MKQLKIIVLCMALVPSNISSVTMIDVASDTVNDIIIIIRQETATMCDFAANFAFAEWMLTVYKSHGLSFKKLYNQGKWGNEKERLFQYMTFICALKCTAYIIKPKMKTFTYQIQH